MITNLNFEGTLNLYVVMAQIYIKYETIYNGNWN
jgi:hypothetical protein